jgi:hypothetical protein
MNAQPQFAPLDATFIASFPQAQRMQDFARLGAAEAQSRGCRFISVYARGRGPQAPLVKTFPADKDAAFESTVEPNRKGYCFVVFGRMAEQWVVCWAGNNEDEPLP